MSADGQVRFRWKDYAHGGKQRVMTLEAGEFIRRFLLHVLPRSFVRIRHYGFLSDRSRAGKLALARQLLAQSQFEAIPQEHTAANERSCEQMNQGAPACPRCKQGRLVLVEDMPPAEELVLQAVTLDTS